ncbi:uncharacterized protein LOC123876926 [Maniola jurtina]|uniref:uncharacterized protein LOC123876926 n=1 Tax=Maniola jurtina TaxID=191418 RepID=UPI001E68E1A2|nr:uncharacterized protein LOC123876926 [Maniola jurtina]
MISGFLSTTMYCFTFLALIVIDYLLGNGFVDFFQKLMDQLIYFIQRSIWEEKKQEQISKDTVSLSILVTEILFLGLTIMFLNKYKHFRSKDRIDDLLKESRESLRQTNEFLDKWRLRRLNMHLPDEYSYLDEEPQEIRPYKLEVPILHMAIIDTLGARNQPESGDAGDLTSYTDSTLLSMTSLLDDDLESLDFCETDGKVEETKAPSRVLWDVAEEERCNLDE